MLWMAPLISDNRHFHSHFTIQRTWSSGTLSKLSMEVERVDHKAFRALSLGQMAILYCLLRVNMDFQLSSHSTVRDCNPLFLVLVLTSIKPRAWVWRPRMNVSTKSKVKGWGYNSVTGLCKGLDATLRTHTKIVMEFSDLFLHFTPVLAQCCEFLH